MATTTTGYLPVPGASIYHEVRGSGPLLLVSQSGEGGAGRSADLVDLLADTCTVVTYDRRGLSRSRMEDPGRGVSMADHADDVHRLLTELTDEPALMLGCSMGAAIGLHVAVRHPGRIATLVAHEPVTPRLLPEPERARHEAELAEIQRLYRHAGLAPALAMIARVLGIDPADQDTEPGLTSQPMTPVRVADFGFFIDHDFTAVLADDLPVAELTGLPTRIVPAAGRTTPESVFDRRCAQELAALVGTELVELPGGHNGNTTHPRAYAARLLATLDATSPERLIDPVAP